MTLQQLYRLLKYGRKQLRAVDCACSKVVPFEVSTVPFNELVQIELAKIDATESEIISFFNRLRLLANKNARVIALKAVFSALLSKTNTHQKTPIQSATNRILFAHLLKDNTSQIDSLAWR
jgi:hypothetical protein